MKKTLGILGMTVATLGLAAGAASSAAARSGNDRDHTIRVDATITEVAMVDLGAKGPSLGDQIVFTNELTRGGREVGHEGAVCTAVSLERQEAQCVATFELRGGQITVQGLVTLGSMETYALAITGGSGAYQDAAGELRVTPVSDTRGRLVLHLDD
ncbi:allene oxide cyclase barrel-like domain-containing protein [Puerhibacterium sp. TATVAM-FAB25]|uniref:allene oxide cyclase barrel-like domain-containing protein n=1 Tax=Puerhibacterium sp. TATVAM-FAB25 TaxID=3093699 RepID=UPI00397DD2E1